MFLTSTKSIFLSFLALAISAFYILDPSDAAWGADNFSILKYLPYVLCGFSVLLCFLIGEVVRKVNVWQALVSILFFWMFSGALITLSRGVNVEESYLGRSLAIFPFLAGALAVGHPVFERYLSALVKYVLVPFSILVFFMLLFWQLGFRVVDEKHIYHEEIFVFSASSVFLLSRSKLLSFGFWLSVVLLCLPLLTFKNTGFIVFLLNVAMFVVVLESKRFDNVYARYFIVVFNRLAPVVFLGSLVAIYFVYQDYMPSGSPEVRLKTYEMRFLQFRDSPYWGQFFSESPLIELDTRWGAILVPSHADFLDLLAAGGILAVILLFIPFGMVLSKCRVIMSNSCSAITTFMIFILASGFLVMVFNPVLNQPKLAIWFWFAFGALLGVKCREINLSQMNETYK